MGMFDYVDHEAPCFKCGEMLDDWQSKSGDCSLDTLSTDEVDNFYTSCDKCKTWNEYKAIPQRGRKFKRIDHPYFNKEESSNEEHKE